MCPDTQRGGMEVRERVDAHVGCGVDDMLCYTDDHIKRSSALQGLMGVSGGVNKLGVCMAALKGELWCRARGMMHSVSMMRSAKDISRYQILGVGIGAKGERGQRNRSKDAECSICCHYPFCELRITVTQSHCADWGQEGCRATVGQ